MGKLIETVDLLENKIESLLQKFKVVRQENQAFRDKLKISFQQITELQSKVQELEGQNKNLKAANAILGSNENKKETKLKINSLIKEIDQCIVQLSE